MVMFVEVVLVLVEFGGGGRIEGKWGRLTWGIAPEMGCCQGEPPMWRSGIGVDGGEG